MSGCGPGCGCSKKRQTMIDAVAHVARDPVCGRQVNRNINTTQRLVDSDGEHFFCSTKCMTKFINSPEKYKGEKKGLLSLLGLG